MRNAEEGENEEVGFLSLYGEGYRTRQSEQEARATVYF